MIIFRQHKLINKRLGFRVVFLCHTEVNSLGNAMKYIVSHDFL